MKLQGASALKFAKRPDLNCRLVLAFGDDEGVVSDTANQIIAAWSKTEPATVITLDEDTIKREPSTFFDALEAQSLLGDQTILKIRTKGEKLFSLMKDALAFPQERVAARVILMNGSLNTRSKLRTAFEAGPNSAALHVFADTPQDLSLRISDTLAAQNIKIEPDALSTFIGGLPGHRSLANAEIEKLALYAHDLDRAITRADILALCETNADESARGAVLLALAGQVEAAQAELDRVIDAGLSAISLVRLFEMEASRLLQAQSLQDGSNANVGMKLKPPVWKSDWPAFQTRLKKWPTPRLLRLLERLYDVEKTAKSPGGAGAADPSVRKLLTSLAQAARHI